MTQPTTTPTLRAAAWPVNLSAYRKAIVGAVPGGAALWMLLGSYYGPEQLLAAAITAAGQLAVLFTASPWLKAGFSWVATALASLALVAGSYEGGEGLTWSGMAQWSSSDLATILVLVVTSVLHTALPNAPGHYPLNAPPPAAGGPALATSDQLPDDHAVDLPAPPRASTDGPRVSFGHVDTTVLRALSQAQLAEHLRTTEPRADGTLPRPGTPRDDVDDLGGQGPA